MSQRIERDWLTEESIREHINAGGTLLNNEQVRVLLDEIDSLRKECYEAHQAGMDLDEENDRLRKLVPPETERGPGFVGPVYAEKVVAERDDARYELNTLCEDIRVLKDENDDLRDEVGQLGDIISAMKANTKSEHTNVHYGKEEFIGIDGYGPFSLKKLSKDEWEVRMLQERVILYNKKGRRVRAHIVDGNPEGDW